MLCNSDRYSEPGFGRIPIGRASKSALRPAFGRTEGRFLCFPDDIPAEIWPGSLIAGPETLLRNIGYICESAIGALF